MSLIELKKFFLSSYCSLFFVGLLIFLQRRFCFASDSNPSAPKNKLFFFRALVLPLFDLLSIFGIIRPIFTFTWSEQQFIGVIQNRFFQAKMTNTLDFDSDEYKIASHQLRQLTQPRSNLLKNFLSEYLHNIFFFNVTLSVSIFFLGMMNSKLPKYEHSVVFEYFCLVLGLSRGIFFLTLRYGRAIPLAKKLVASLASLAAIGFATQCILESLSGAKNPIFLLKEVFWMWLIAEGVEWFSYSKLFSVYKLRFFNLFKN